MVDIFFGGSDNFLSQKPHERFAGPKPESQERGDLGVEDVASSAAGEGETVKPTTEVDNKAAAVKNRVEGQLPE